MERSASLTQQASRGAFWSFASNVTVSAASFVGTAILAHILSPKDFGLIGMAVLVTGIIRLFGDFGLGAALVQKKNVDDKDLSTAFWANCAAAVVLALSAVLAAPFAGMFFHEKAVQWIIIFLAVNFIFSALASIHSMLLYKNIKMKPLAFVEVSGRILRVGVMLIAAFFGFGFWCIVIGMITERIFKTVSFFFLDPWRPSFHFSAQSFKEMFHFGRNFLGMGLLDYLNSNMDFIVTGRILGAALLGFYQMGYNVPHLISNYISDSVGNVSYPVYCKVKDDNVRLTTGLLKITKFIALGTFPILAGLAFTAHDFILVVYGAKWLPVVPPLRILSFSAALISVNSVVVPLLNAKGRPDLSLKWGCIRLPATVIAILIGVHYGGIVGVAWGMLAVQFISIAIIYTAFRILERSMNEYWKALFPATVASLVMIGGLFILSNVSFLKEIPPLLGFLIQLFTGGILYISVVAIGFNETFHDFLETTTGVFGL